MARSQPTIAVHCAAAARCHEASALAVRLFLPLAATSDPGFDFLLTYTTERLELRKTGRSAPGPVYVDFVGGPFGYRRLHGGGRMQHLARAAGLRSAIKPSILDATAGLGRDAFMLAALGCRVLMLERSPISHALLADGLKRASLDPLLSKVTDERLALRCEDAILYLTRLPAHIRPDVIYLDPMYPKSSRSALNKKEMRLLREVAGDDEDAPELLALSLRTAGTRVVVKRPRLAPSIEGSPPDAQIRGAATRYDVYSLRKRTKDLRPE
jgi:16S rRNA (guanine1516-N2)-methyltransferase